MSYATIPTRTTSDPNSASDINQLQDNFDALLDGSKNFATLSATTVDIKQNIVFTDSTITTGLYGSGSELKYSNTPLQTQGISMAIGGSLSTGENQVLVPIPHSFTVNYVKAGVITPPAGSTLAIDINYHASNPASLGSIFTTQGNRPQISDGNYTDISGTPDTTALSAGGFLSISIDDIGSATAGSTLGVVLVAK